MRSHTVPNGYWGDRMKLICFPPRINSELGPFDVQSTVEPFSNTGLRHEVDT
ncbi:MAG: hypothetical protein ACRC8Y_25805 [Chroococcales cyanobacterium]